MAFIDSECLVQISITDHIVTHWIHLQDNPMSLQLEQYKNVTALLTMEMGEFAAKKLISASFFVIASGSNDLGTGYLQNPVHQAQYSATQYITMLLEAYQTDLQVIQSIMEDC
jgi:hypothetical protein